MAFMGGTLAYVWGVLNTWKARADDAWGASGVWNSGTSFEAAAYDNSGGSHPPGYSAGQLWSETASEWKSDRDSVYTSRYNDGVTAGAASKTTTSQATSTGSGSTSGSSWTGTQASLSAPRTGLAHVSAIVSVVRSSSSDPTRNAQLRLKKNGSVVETGSQVVVGATDDNTFASVHWSGAVNNGDTITLEYLATGAFNTSFGGGSGGTMRLTVGSV